MPGKPCLPPQRAGIGRVPEELVPSPLQRWDTPARIRFSPHQSPCQELYLNCHLLSSLQPNQVEQPVVWLPFRIP